MFNEFRDDIIESHNSTPNFESTIDNNLETSSSEFDLNTYTNYFNISDDTVNNFVSNFEEITMFTDNESTVSHINNIIDEAINQQNLPSTSNSHKHIHKRKIQNSVSIIKKPKVQYNGISSPLKSQYNGISCLLKRSDSTLLNEEYKKKLNSNLNNIENDNKLITDIPLNYNQSITCKDIKSIDKKAMNAELQNLCNNKFMIFKKRKLQKE